MNICDFVYPSPSTVLKKESTTACNLATFTESKENSSPFFFQGQLLQPEILAKVLVLISKVVASDFRINVSAILKDPVITSGEEVIRFEGFSGCCGVAIRVDANSEAYKAERHEYGTTNIDFNHEMLAGLASIGKNDSVSFAIGSDEFSVIKGADQIVEKKVKLPDRWLKGFVEAGAYQSSMHLAYELRRPQAMRLIQTLSKKSAGAKVEYLEQFGQSLRFSMKQSSSALMIGGRERLHFLSALGPFIQKLKIYTNERRDVSSWVADCGDISVTLTLSPEIYRGFSGEGQLLSDLTDDEATYHADSIKSLLSGQSAIDISSISSSLNLKQEQVSKALNNLSNQGIVGYDLNSSKFFHREMPFSPERLKTLNPRLKGAHKLIEKNLVSIVSESEAIVQGSGVKYKVYRKSDKWACDCPWYTKYKGERGNCKHVLAVELTFNQSKS